MAVTPDPTRSEIVVARVNLENKILEAVKEFTLETGVMIDEIKHTYQYHEDGGISFILNQLIKVTLDL